MGPRRLFGVVVRPLNFTVRGLVTQRYEYSIHLRVRHPTIDASVISRGLRMRPRVSWRVGDPCVTPTGTPLRGVRTDTYWNKTITPGGATVPSSKIAAYTISRLLLRLRRHAQFLRRLQRSGGTIEIWLSSFRTTNYSFTLTHELIESIHRLGCVLIVDVYPYRQNWGL